MTDDSSPQATLTPPIRTRAATAPLGWLAAGAADFRAHPLPSLFYGVCFAVMGWLVVVVFRHATAYLSSLVTGFFLVGPFLATGFYALSRARARGETVRLAPTLDAWRPNVGAIGVFAIVLAVILLVWARASLVVFALFYTSEMPTVDGFLSQVLEPSNLEFLVAYACVGGFFALLVLAISAVSVPMMLDRGTDGVVAVLTSAKAFAANPLPMAIWGALIVAIVAAGFATFFVGLVVAVPLIGHATWHAYVDLVGPAA